MDLSGRSPLNNSSTRYFVFNFKHGSIPVSPDPKTVYDLISLAHDRGYYFLTREFLQLNAFNGDIGNFFSGCAPIVWTSVLPDVSEQRVFLPEYLQNNGIDLDQKIVAMHL